ncbi:MAG: tRNA 2-thiouridine(34) synthase MnmA [Alphaproteobacteria bacterium]|uniref:tRNA-specific 2-thiouridylase MnmA n=1 Tax=Candidatus Nitrobium versatile TaxID=2884831 RepID=A0A953JB61_9BACT|nr:tRNA 2-thiouridine(34) synthase MnmA [Candidatus Nitrobium versatile]
MKKVIVGMSGGVDSSVTAYLLREQGYEVEGVSFILYEARMKSTFSGCCSLASIDDARRTAGHMGVRHSAVDLREEFMEKVIEPFIAAYARGSTPNPCILCNKYIKFPHLLQIAHDRGADCIATGHYAKVEGALLRKGADARKDQSYVLYVLSREERERLVLPLGDKRKDEVREIARSLGLPAANRPESQEICFVEDNNYSRFMEGLTEGGEGEMIDSVTGKVLGRHRGIHLYTVGQRKRLGIATGEPRYVVEIDPSTCAVYIGPKVAALMRTFEVAEVNWLVEGAGVQERREVSVKVRSTMRDEPAVIERIGGDRVRVTFDEPQWAPAPGQSAVFYEGDTVLGGGIIDRNR